VRIKSLMFGIMLIGIACCVNADEGKETQRINKPETTVDTIKQDLIDKAAKEYGTSQAIIALRVEALKWKKQFYAQKSEAMQLKYMIQCWNDSAFQEVQRIGKETDRELKNLLILQ